jgi:hypothetical protein
LWIFSGSYMVDIHPHLPRAGSGRPDYRRAVVPHYADPRDVYSDRPYDPALRHPDVLSGTDSAAFRSELRRVLSGLGVRSALAPTHPNARVFGETTPMYIPWEGPGVRGLPSGESLIGVGAHARVQAKFPQLTMLFTQAHESFHAVDMANDITSRFTVDAMWNKYKNDPEISRLMTKYNLDPAHVTGLSHNDFNESYAKFSMDLLKSAYEKAPPEIQQYMRDLKLSPGSVGTLSEREYGAAIDKLSRQVEVAQKDPSIAGKFGSLEPFLHFTHTASFLAENFADTAAARYITEHLPPSARGQVEEFLKEWGELRHSFGTNSDPQMRDADHDSHVLLGQAASLPIIPSESMRDVADVIGGLIASQTNHPTPAPVQPTADEKPPPGNGNQAPPKQGPGRHAPVGPGGH